MLLAGILLKMGAYGLIRINMELLPHAHYLFSPWLVNNRSDHLEDHIYNFPQEVDRI